MPHLFLKPQRVLRGGRIGTPNTNGAPRYPLTDLNCHSWYMMEPVFELTILRLSILPPKPRFPPNPPGSCHLPPSSPQTLPSLSWALALHPPRRRTLLTWGCRFVSQFSSELWGRHVAQGTGQHSVCPQCCPMCLWSCTRSPLCPTSPHGKAAAPEVENPQCWTEVSVWTGPFWAPHPNLPWLQKRCPWVPRAEDGSRE